MKNENLIYSPEERAMNALGQLYRKSGYIPYKMNKFEDYDFYANNKDFLVSENIITFTDTSGKLKALKPDVTLSIVKNTVESDGYNRDIPLNRALRKVCYTENVYRVTGGTHSFREIPQTGIECIGDVDTLQLCEVISLAADSLRLIGSDCILDISHMGIITGLLSECNINEEKKRDLLTLAGMKNRDGIRVFCDANKIPRNISETLTSLVLLYGDSAAVLPELRGLLINDCMKAAYDELVKIDGIISEKGLSGIIKYDFSILNDLNYYSGIVFKGYLNGVPVTVLSGGSYDRLMNKFGSQCGAVGFAVYLDTLEFQRSGQQATDVDVLLIYNDNNNIGDVIAAADNLRGKGFSVLTGKCEYPDVRAAHICRLCGKELIYD